MTTTIKQPTPQGISRLLTKAGFQRAQITGLAWGSPGYVSRRDWAGEGVRVTYFSPSGATRSEYKSAMLGKYATALKSAGWRVETGVGAALIVTAPGSEAGTEG